LPQCGEHGEIRVARHLLNLSTLGFISQFICKEMCNKMLNVVKQGYWAAVGFPV